MSEPTPPKTPGDAGLRALVWIASLAAVLLLVWLVMEYALPAPQGLGPWTPHGARPLVVTTTGPFRHELLSTPASLETVTRWYDKKLSMEGASAGFSMGNGLFGDPRQQVKIGLPNSAANGGTWYCEITKRELTAAVVFRTPDPSGTSLKLFTGTSIQLFRLMSASPEKNRGNQAAAVLNALAYPGAQRGSSGGAAGVSACSLSASDAPERVLAHYLQRFGAPAPATLAARSDQAFDVTVGPFVQPTGAAPMGNRILRLPGMPGTGDVPATLLLLTPTNLCFLHLAVATNTARTEMILGVIDR